MDDTEIIDIEHVAPLHDDNIPDANQSHNCFSCGENMEGIYCYACGNKNDNYRRSIWSLGTELFSSLTALEGRIWRSLRSLIFNPGVMAREFADGARQKWTSPVRLFLATSLLLFGYIAISQTQLIAFGTKDYPNSAVETSTSNQNFAPQIFFLERKRKIREMMPDEAIAEFEGNVGNIIERNNNQSISGIENELRLSQISLKQLDRQLENIEIIYAKPGLIAAKKAVEERIKTLETSLELKKAELETPAGALETSEPEKARDNSKPIVSENEQTEDAKQEGAKEEDGGNNLRIIDMQGREFKLDAEGFKEAAAIALREPERINEPINKYLSRIMFFMMPFSILIGALFIRGKKQAMLYDHLVHAAYIHAFAFMLLFIFILLVQFTPIKGLIFIYTTILLIYLPMSAKRMFARGWFKTFLTSYGVGVFYTFTMSIILIILIALGLIDIVKEVAQSGA